MALGIDPATMVGVINAQNQLSRDQQLANRIDRCGAMLANQFIQVAGISGAVSIPAADKLYTDSAGKAFGPII